MLAKNLLCDQWVLVTIARVHVEVLATGVEDLVVDVGLRGSVVC